MKKMVSLLLVIITITAMCSVAAAATPSNAIEKNGYAPTIVSMPVYDVSTQNTANENVPVAVWIVVGRCYYVTYGNNTYYPESASIQGTATFSPYAGGVSGTLRGQYQSSTSQRIENSKRVMVTLYYTCPVSVVHRTNAAKQNADSYYPSYIYSTNTTTTEHQSSTSISFYRFN